MFDFCDSCWVVLWQIEIEVIFQNNLPLVLILHDTTVFSKYIFNFMNLVWVFRHPEGISYKIISPASTLSWAS